MNHAWIQMALAIMLSLSAPIYLQGCGGGEKPKAEAHGGAEHDHDHDHDHAGHDHEHDHDHEGHDHEGHAHKAPHGGTLVAIGSHFAHVEVVVDAETGRISAYVLDGEAERPIRIAQKNLPIKVKLLDGPEPRGMAFNLEAVANTLTGETAGDTSEFSLTNDKLKGVTRFEGTILSLEIQGQSVKDTEFKFPEGNE